MSHRTQMGMTIAKSHAIKSRFIIAASPQANVATACPFQSAIQLLSLFHSLIFQDGEVIRLIVQCIVQPCRGCAEGEVRRRLTAWQRQVVPSSVRDPRGHPTQLNSLFREIVLAHRYTAQACPAPPFGMCFTSSREGKPPAADRFKLCPFARLPLTGDAKSQISSGTGAILE